MDRKSQFAKMLVIPNLVNRFNAIPIQTTVSYLIGIDKQILNVHTKGKYSK